VKAYGQPPTISGIDAETKEPTALVYGSKTGLPDDEVTEAIRSIPFSAFLNQFPHHKEGLWGFTEEIGRGLGIPAKAGKLKKQFADSHWSFR